MHEDVITRSKSPVLAHAHADYGSLERVETMIVELKDTLAHNKNVFDDESIRGEIGVMEHWMGCYRRGLFDADMFSQVSWILLCDLRNRLKLSAEEMQRLEGEGGNPASNEQAGQTEELFKAVRRSEKLLNHIEELLPADKA